MKKALNFSLPDQNGQIHQLSDYLGKKVILYFYPKDNTKGCTLQALGFKEYYEKLKEKNVEIIGISKDSVKSHDRFACKYELPFTLLSDESTEVIQAYGVWQEKKLYGKTYMGIVRTTFVIDEEGYIIKEMPKVKAGENAKEIYEWLFS